MVVGGEWLEPSFQASYGKLHHALVIQVEHVHSGFSVGVWMLRDAGYYEKLRILVSPWLFQPGFLKLTTLGRTLT